MLAVTAVVSGAVTGACDSGGLVSGGSFQWDAPRTVLDSAFVEARALYRRDADYEAAFDRFGELAERAGAVGDSAQVARAITWMGLAAWRMDDYEQAKELGRRALEMKQRLRLEAQLFRSYNALGLLAWIEGRLNDAAELFDAARSAGVYEDPLDQVAAESNLGLVLTDLSRFEEAAAHFQSAQATYAAVGDWREARVLTDFAALHSNAGEPSAAIRSLTRALEIYEAERDPIGQQNAIGQLGGAYLTLGDFERARIVLDSAVSLAGALGQEREVASNLALLAEVHRRTGDLRVALGSLTQATEINRRLGLPFETAGDLRAAASIHMQLGNLTTALDLARNALAEHRALGARLEELYDLLTISEIQRRSGATVRPAELDEAIELGGLVGVSSASRDAAVALARWHLHAGQHDRALAAIDSIDVGGAGRTERAELLRLRAEALRELGRLDEAQDAIDEATQVRRTVRERTGPSRRIALASDLSEYQEIGFTIALRRGDVDRAFAVADDARSPRWSVERGSVEGDDGRAAGGASAGATFEALARAERDLRLANHLEWVADSLAGAPEDWRGPDYPQEVAAAVEGARQAAREADAALRRAQATDPRADILTGGSYLRIDSLRAALDPSEAVLAFFVESSGVHAFAVTEEQVTHAITPIDRSELRSRIRAASEQTMRDRGTAAQPMLAGLYELLIRPVEGLLYGASTIAIVPHAELAYVPWPALTDATSDQFSIERWTLQYAPSVRAFIQLRRSERGTSGLRHVIFAPSTDDLPYSRTEAEAIAAATSDTEVLLDEAATEGAFRTRLASGHVLHAAAHGALDPRRPLYSSVRLAPGSDDPNDDGNMELHEVLSLRSSSPLVFLSACETGVGLGSTDAFQWGDDVSTLSQAFLFAGVESVVSTLWKIEDRAAAELAQRFYAHWRPGRTADALAAAQREMLRTPGLSSPAYWAGHQTWSAEAPERVAQQ